MLHLHPDRLTNGARQIVQRLQRFGYTAYWAGGCVRDLIMGREPKDYDVATSATPDQAIDLFPESILVGKAFGVVRVGCGPDWYEVATFRKDHAYKDGRHPEGVSFTDAEHDAQRRDFTVNALFYDPTSSVIHDYVEGQRDIENRIIRTVGNPDHRFEEDFLRMIRASRFSASLQFPIEPATSDSIRRHAHHITAISVERIQQELTRTLLEAPRPGDALRLLDDLGLLKEILPEVAATKGQQQPAQFHPEGDVFTHTVLMLNAMRQTSLPLAYAVLLHDIGKPCVAKQVGDRIRFDNHAAVGATLAETVLRRLRFPTDAIKAITYSIGNHMRFMDVRKMRRATLHRLVGAPTFPLELELHRLDCDASHGDLENYRFLVDFEKTCESQPVLPKPWITGRDIMALGIPEGQEIGLWKQRAYDEQLEGRVRNRMEALRWLKRKIGKPSNG